MKFLFAILLFFFSVINIGECREFVFVANTGQSMEKSDPFHKVADGITWAVATLNEDDEAGIITFGDAIKIERPLSKISDNPNATLNFQYEGASNPGAALLKAVDMLIPKFNTERIIIFIGDDENFSDAAAKNFQAALDQAKWNNIAVYIINLRYDGEHNNYQSYTKTFPTPHEYFMTTLRKIFYNDFHAPYLNLFEDRLTSQNLKISLPIISEQNIELQLISDNAGTANLSNAKNISGRFVNIFDLNFPQNKEIDIEINYPPNTALTLDAVFKIKGSLQIDNLKTAIKITALDEQGRNIFEDKFFNGKNIRLKINDKIFGAKIFDGSITVDLSNEGRNISLQKVFFEDTGIIFEGNDTAELVLSQKNFLPYILAALAILLILFLAWRKKNLTASSVEKVSTQEKIIFPKFIEKQRSFSYSGKIIIYFIKSPSSEEISPREFNLFRLNVEQINLTEILQSCGIEEKFNGSDNIIISSSKKGILVTNKSTCTIIKRNNLIEKGRPAELYYNDAISIITEDENFELTLIYKSLKPVL